MSSLDWVIVAAYVACAFGVGLAFARRAGKDTSEFFIAGRSLPWYVAGTSMVATSFSSDTPVFIAGMVREDGIYANWIWWSWIIGFLVTVFFFARLWRRTGAVTEIEFLALRYDRSRAASGLRIFKALYDGVFVNCVIIASVSLAMSKIIVVITGISQEALFHVPLIGDISPVSFVLAGLGVGALIYTILSGLYGVVYTDLIQFALAMIGTFALAIIVYLDLESQGGFVQGIRHAADFDPRSLDPFPEFGWNLGTATFVILVTVGWWIHAPGTGYVVQRTLATRSEKDAILALYWYAFCHFVLRTWPWIVVGMASLVYFPALADAEQAYPAMINEFLPLGLKGVMVASLLAAFMSTLDTHMNWGASYLVNDIYKPFLARNRTATHYVKAARVCMLLIVVIATLISTALTGVLDTIKYLTVMVSGTAFAVIARWYWWRINVWSEISSMIASLIVGNLLFLLLPDTADHDLFAIRLLINVVACTGICVLVTFVTSSAGATAQCRNFYRKMRIAGAGWERVRRELGLDGHAGSMKSNLIACVASIVGMYALLLGAGYLLFGNSAGAAVCAILLAIAGWAVKATLPRVLAGET